MGNRPLGLGGHYSRPVRDCRVCRPQAGGDAGGKTQLSQRRADCRRSAGTPGIAIRDAEVSFAGLPNWKEATRLT